MLVTVRAKKVSRSDYFVKNGYTYTKVSLFFKGGGGYNWILAGDERAGTREQHNQILD